MKPASRCRRQAGFTLIDVLVIIVLLGTVAGSLTVLFSRLAAESAETMRQRQTLGIAQALLAEVRMMPFTVCDPKPAVPGPPGCSAVVDGLGPEPGESRYTPGNRFDGVSDYHGLALPGPGCLGGICDINGVLINGPGSPLAGCSAGVTTTPLALPGVAAAQAWRIVVTVTCAGQPTVVEGVRVRHAPNQI